MLVLPGVAVPLGPSQRWGPEAVDPDSSEETSDFCHTRGKGAERFRSSCRETCELTWFHGGLSQSNGPLRRGDSPLFKRTDGPRCPNCESTSRRSPERDGAGMGTESARRRQLAFGSCFLAIRRYGPGWPSAFLFSVHFLVLALSGDWGWRPELSGPGEACDPSQSNGRSQNYSVSSGGFQGWHRVPDLPFIMIPCWRCKARFVWVAEGRRRDFACEAFAAPY